MRRFQVPRTAVATAVDDGTDPVTIDRTRFVHLTGPQPAQGMEP